MSADLTDSAEFMATVLESNPDYRVIRRFRPRGQYNEPPSSGEDGPEPAPFKTALFVDCESTGLDTEHDEVIELGIVPFEFDAQGLIYDVGEPMAYSRDPGIPIAAEITKVTGITDDMVRGQSIDRAAVASALANASIVIAHVARFDRRMLERVVPEFAGVFWACSQEEIPWREFGVAGGALANILMTTCGEFLVDAHRATNDCLAGVHILAAAELNGRTAFQILLDSARQPTHRVCAMDSPMSAKGVLKGRGYRALYVNDRFQYWYKDLRQIVGSDVVGDECDWCTRYAGAYANVKKLTARDRYSIRTDR